MTHDEMIAVIQAHKEGKKLECKCKAIVHDGWVSAPVPLFDFHRFDYRVKPEPRVVEGWTKECFSRNGGWSFVVHQGEKTDESWVKVRVEEVIDETP
jgi:hypothetical protein